MNAAPLTQFLIDIVRGRLSADFRADPEATIRASSLDIELQQAIRAGDIGALWLADAHPMALMYFARSLGWSNERYYGALAEAELRRSAQASSAPAGANAPPHTHR